MKALVRTDEDTLSVFLVSDDGLYRFDGFHFRDDQTANDIVRVINARSDMALKEEAKLKSSGVIK